MTSTTSQRQAPAVVHSTPSRSSVSRQTTDVSTVKDEARRSLAPGDLGRELVLALPDRMDDHELDALFPTLVRVLRERSQGSRP